MEAKMADDMGRWEDMLLLIAKDPGPFVGGASAPAPRTFDVRDSSDMDEILGATAGVDLDHLDALGDILFTMRYGLFEPNRVEEVISEGAALLRDAAARGDVSESIRRHAQLCGLVDAGIERRERGAVAPDAYREKSLVLNLGLLDERDVADEVAWTRIDAETDLRGVAWARSYLSEKWGVEASVLDATPVQEVCDAACALDALGVDEAEVVREVMGPTRSPTPLALANAAIQVAWAAEDTLPDRGARATAPKESGAIFTEPPMDGRVDLDFER